MNILTKVVITTLATITLSLSIIDANADEKITLASTNNAIPGLSKLIAQIKPKSDVPVIFPTVVPKSPDNDYYYVSTDPLVAKYGINYIINVDATKDCKGAHYCNIGYLKAERGNKLQIYRDRTNKEITTTLVLTHNINGYYTPGHPMGDYFPPNIQWVNKKVLYTISWNPAPGLSEATMRNLLVTLANSAIKSEM
ncbi:hypothetical protein BH10PSE19_BH10PSE19_07530 [soil metagenome]